VRTIGVQPMRPQAMAGGVDPSERPRTAVVRPLQPVSTAKPHVVAPTSFNHAQEVADKLKVSLPVIVNLQNVDRDLSRRIIDFASGLCYGVGGQMERVANNVFLLTPSNVEVSAEERRRLEERGYGES
jgi:cell division inhibitor SepF